MLTKREEFNEQLVRLRSAALWASWYYTIWIALWPTEEVVSTLNLWKGFFGPVRSALHEMMFIHLSKLFDRDWRAVSLRRLLESAKGDSNLIPHANEKQLNEIEFRLSCLENSQAWKIIKQNRDQQLAHLDANPLEKKPLIKKDFDNFREDIEWVFDQLFSMHDGSMWDSSYQAERSTWEASELLRILREEADHSAQRVSEIMRALQEGADHPLV